MTLFIICVFKRVFELNPGAVKQYKLQFTQSFTRLDEHTCGDMLKGRHDVSHLRSLLNVRCCVLMSEAEREQAGNCLLAQLNWKHFSICCRQK